MLYCFVSYARDDADRYLDAFLGDFHSELRGHLGATRADELFFRDSDNVKIGGRWEAAIERALCDCRSFIAMLSPLYIQRPSCSEEWASFEWRLKVKGGASPPELLLPLMWMPILDDDMPPAVKARQHAHRSLGTTYAVRGLREVVRNGGPEYYELLSVLATHVRDLVRRPLPPLDSLDGAGGSSDPFAKLSSAVATTPAAVPAPRGPRHVAFIVVVAAEPEIRARRNVRIAYGDTSDAWRPYVPVTEAHVGPLVQSIAAAEDLTSGVEAVTNNVVKRLEESAVSNTIAVLIVDVWSLRVDTYRQWMQEVDKRRFRNAAALVLWNPSDGETPEFEQTLQGELQDSFPYLTTIQKDPLVFHDRVSSAQDLQAALRAVLEEVRRRILMYGSVKSRASGGPPIAQPHITGPGERG